MHKQALKPIGRRLGHVDVVFTNTPHEVVIAHDQYDQQRELSIGRNIRPGTFAEELQRRTKTFLHANPSALPVNGIDLIEYQMGNEADHDRPRLENSNFKITGQANEKRRQPSNQGCWNAVPHTTMFCIPAKQTTDAEPDHHVHHASDEDHVFRRHAKCFESLKHQHRYDDRNEREHLPLWNSRVTVEIGQHARDATQTTCNEAVRNRDVKHRSGYRSVADPENRTGRNVGFEISHE